MYVNINAHIYIYSYIYIDIYIYIYHCLDIYVCPTLNLTFETQILTQVADRGEQRLLPAGPGYGDWIHVAQPPAPRCDAHYFLPPQFTSCARTSECARPKLGFRHGEHVLEGGGSSSQEGWTRIFKECAYVAIPCLIAKTVVPAETA